MVLVSYKVMKLMVVVCVWGVIGVIIGKVFSFVIGVVGFFVVVVVVGNLVMWMGCVVGVIGLMDMVRGGGVGLGCVVIEGIGSSGRLVLVRLLSRVRCYNFFCVEVDR